MLIGEFQHSLDTKGRLIIPQKLRSSLGDTFVVTKGIDSCLFAYPLDEWKIFEDKLRKLPLVNSDARKFVRFFLSGAVECEVDSQGRILLPAKLKEHANLKKELVSVGIINRVEIWDKDTWEKYNEENNDLDIDFAEKMESFGI